jgi:hypothetical protein
MPAYFDMNLLLVACGGLTATAQLAPIAKDLKLGTIPVSLRGLSLPALTFALTIHRVLNGLTRPFFGWVYGSRYATTNAGLLYTAKGIVSLLVPFADILAQKSDGWLAVFPTSRRSWSGWRSPIFRLGW